MRGAVSRWLPAPASLTRRFWSCEDACVTRHWRAAETLGRAWASMCGGAVPAKPGPYGMAPVRNHDVVEPMWDVDV